MKKRALSLILCLSILFSMIALPVGAAEETERSVYVPQQEFEIVGDWVWGETVYSLGAAKIVDRSARMGVTDLYMLTKGTGGKLSYLKTQYTNARARTDRDVLQELIVAAHAKGIKVHAWLVTVEDELYKTNHPEAGVYHYVRGRDNNRINPYDAGYQTYMTNIVKEIASGYDIDGIHLDYIRYNHLTNGWSETDFANIQAMGADVEQVKYMLHKTFYADKLPAGETVDENYLFNAYRNGDKTALLIGQYRRNQIVNFATLLRDAAKAAKADILFTGALMPEGGITYGSADVAFGDLHYGQNYEDAAKLYDYICPMAYSASYGVESQWMADIATYSVQTGNQVVMGLQSFYPLTSVELMSDIEAVRALLPMDGVLGIAHFRHTQFSYAKTSYNCNTGKMEIEVINASDAGGLKWLKVEVPEGMKITKASVGSGFKSASPVNIASNGRSVTFGYSESSSSTILNALAEGKLNLEFTGKPTDEKARPSLVRIYIGSNESRAYNVYEDLTNFKVKFVDHDGTVLATKTAVPGGSVQAPADPVRYGYVFTGWDQAFDAVNADMTVTAQYKKINVDGEFQIVGDWVWGEDVYNLGANTVVDRSAKYGVTDLYMLTKGTGGKLSYLKTQYTDARTRTDRDVLQELIVAAHAKGIKVHAWLVTVEDELYKTNHPEAGVYHYVRGQDNNRINPYDAGYQTYMTNIVKEIASGYDIDGIHLDYIRYNHLTNGWSETDFANIQAMGADVEQVKYMLHKTFYADKLPAGETVDENYIFDAYRSGDETALLIGQYRRNQIVDFATKLRNAAKAAKSDILFTGALMPEGGITYGSADIAFGDLHYGQNYKDAAKLYDYIAPMAYSASYGVEPKWMADIATYSVQVGNDVVMGLQSFYPLTSARLMADINAVRDLLPMEGVLGIAHFRHSQFSYAKSVFDYSSGKMSIDFLNASSAGGCKWVKVEVPAGMQITKASLGSGFTSGAPVTIASDGRTVTFGYSESSSSTVIGALKEGKLNIEFTGKPTDEKARPSLVRLYISSNESRAYNVYEDHTLYTVTFKDHEGNVIASKDTYAGGTVLEPAAPEREGYTFVGWDKDFSVVKEDLTVTATYELDGPKEFRIVGEWVWGEDIFNLGADTVVGRCAQMGVTDLYLLVKGTGGTLSFLKTQYTDALARTDRDVLQETIDMAHAAGIRVHAWLVTVEDALYKENHPEAAMYHYIRGTDNNRINPYDEGYRTYMANLTKELVSGYDIDGIHLDYIRYNHLCNGWSETDFANLQAMGADVERVKYLINKTFYADKLPEGESVDENYIFNAYDNGDKDALLIAEYRRNNIVELANVILDAAKSVAPDLIYSAAVMPEGGVLNGSANVTFADLHYGQNYEDAVGLYDYIAPMAYTDSYGAGPEWFAGIAKYAAELGNGVVMGTQAFYPSVSAGLMAEVEATRALLPMKGILGIAHFRHSQFSYVKFATDMAAGEIDVHAINTYNAGGFKWLRIEAAEGVKFTGAQYLNGFVADAPIEIAADGSYIVFGYDETASDAVLGTLAEGDLRITFTGEPTDPDARIALARIYINSNESRAYNVYEARCSHAWNAGEITKAPGCGVSGIQAYTCELCGQIRVEVLPALEHSKTYTYVDEASHKITCENCDLEETETHRFINGLCVCGAEDGKAVVNENLKLAHSLNLASDISVNYVLSKAAVDGYDLSTLYLEIQIDEYSGNTKTGYSVHKLSPEDRGNNYYFVLDGLTAVHMNNELRAVVYGRKNGQLYCSAVDTYSVAQYAYSQLNKPQVLEGLKPLCADLLRYGAKAQIFKNYRTDALADQNMTDAHKAFLSDLSAVTFGDMSLEMPLFADPTVQWAGKALDLNAKVGIRYVVDLSKYNGKVEDLTLRVSFVDIYGVGKTVTVEAPESYKEGTELYAFTFDGLLAAELRTVLSAVVYEKDEAVSNELLYSADTYGNGKVGNLGELCKALFAYSDSAKSYFVK
ncbi:MAG: family 10 glycosylhydrolase [Oscillospiraceae bacterium]|nr:family 10 glycosylhydrolase [Oscillospiraceae bacterium]